jgi:sec-independent protein translocase protein TatB
MLSPGFSTGCTGARGLRYDETTMPSLGDSIFIFVLALMLVGPKNLPKLARQLGKLMAEFRRASNEFRMQMEDELRVEEQKEHQAKVAAMPGPPSSDPAPTPDFDATPSMEADGVTAQPAPPIAESGSLKMMPPSTGLPVESATYGTSHTEAELNDAAPVSPVAEVSPVSEIPEHTIHQTSTGISSEEPHEQAHV